MANNPMHLAGAIDAANADKAARFMQLCEAFGLPILSLCDTPGFMVGPAAEETALVRHVSRMFVVGASLTVPFACVVLRKGYGLGAQAMAAGGFHRPIFTVAWPTGELGGMGLEGAVRLGFRRELEAIADPDEREAAFAAMVFRAYQHGKALNVAEYFEIDDVIDPAETRARTIHALDSAGPRAHWSEPGRVGAHAGRRPAPPVRRHVVRPRDQTGKDRHDGSGRGRHGHSRETRTAGAAGAAGALSGAALEAEIERLLGAMTLDEKASLTAGVNLWYLPPVERLGIPALKVSDGPVGRAAVTASSGAARSPCPAVWRSGRPGTRSWSSAWARCWPPRRGPRAYTCCSGPTVCIVRTPLAGRTFESFSEDPLLTARIAVSYVRGVQAGGVACCIKHYACNDQEHERMTISAEVDERTLREIHLVAFEEAVREAGVWSVMTAYNKVNGTYCGEQPELIAGILRGEWDFDGLVVSDWFGTHSTAPAALAGLDLEMPGPSAWFGPTLAGGRPRGNRRRGRSSTGRCATSCA